MTRRPGSTMFFRKTEKPSIDRRQSLEGIPVLNPGVATDEREDHTLVLRVPAARGQGFLARFQPEVIEKQIKLDAVGSFVVRQIDGRRNVFAIVEALIGRYKLNRREAELSCVEFLRSLAQRRAISIAIK